MIRKFLLPILILVTVVTMAQAQTTLKTLSLSSDFSAVAGTPRVVRNGFKHFWVAVWRQQGNPAKLVSRIIQSDGTTGGPKVLASGVTGFENAFDIAYDTINYTYLLAFETSKGLQVQFFNSSFAKSGQPVLIEGGLSDTNPRLAYDPVGKKFTIFYLASQDAISRRILKSRSLDAQGKPLADAKTLASAGTGKTYGPMSVSINAKNGSLLVLIMHNTASAGELLGFAVKADGSLLKTAPLRLQPNTPGLNANADAGFNDDGSGFAMWADRTSVKFRKMNAALGFAGPTKALAGAADTNSQETTIVVDTRNSQLLPVWAKGNQVVSASLSPVTGALNKPVFTVAPSALSNSRNAVTSYDPTQGNALAVWEDSSAPAPGASADTKFRIRAAIFVLAVAAPPTTISVGDNFFSPAQMTVPTGTTVKWTFDGNNQHTVSSSTGAFESGTQGHGATFEFRFTSAGTFNYFCRVHGQAMSGSITVTNSQEPPPHY